MLTQPQSTQRPEYRLSRKRRGVEPLQRQQERIHKARAGDGREELGGLTIYLLGV